MGSVWRGSLHHMSDLSSSGRTRKRARTMLTHSSTVQTCQTSSSAIIPSTTPAMYWPTGLPGMGQFEPTFKA